MYQWIQFTHIALKKSWQCIFSFAVKSVAFENYWIVFHIWTWNISKFHGNCKIIEEFRKTRHFSNLKYYKMILKRQCSQKHHHHSKVFLSNKSTVISDLMLFFTKNLILSQNGPKGTHLKNNDTFSLSTKNLLNPRSDTFYLAFYWADSTILQLEFERKILREHFRAKTCVCLPGGHP